MSLFFCAFRHFNLWASKTTLRRAAACAACLIACGASSVVAAEDGANDAPPKARMGKPSAPPTAEKNRLSDVAGHLTQARRQYEAEGSVENKIRLATWLLMFAEVATTEPEAGLWSSSIDAFEEGNVLLAQVEAEIEKNPQLEKQISAAPAVAMRLDAARVRKAQIERRHQLARDQELERLHQLREIARAYRDLTREMAVTQLKFLSGDYEAARKANEAVLAKVAQIEKIAASRKDYHLFYDEPQSAADADFQSVNAAPEPLSPSTTGFLKSLHGYLAYQLGTAGEKPDAALLAESAQWAREALESGDGILAHYVLAAVGDATANLKAAADPFGPSAREAIDAANGAAKKHFDEFARLSGPENQPAAGAPTALTRRARQTRARLEDAGVYRAEAAAMTDRGEVQQAWLHLRQGAARHPRGSLWLACAESGRRAQVPAAELLGLLDRAAEAQYLSSDDPAVRLTRAKIVLAEFWRTLGARGLANLNGQELAKLTSDVQRQVDSLREAVAGGKVEQPLLAKLQAQLALAIAYLSMARPDRPGIDGALREGYRLAQDASAALESRLAAQEKVPTLQRVALREGLIASRLALGFLALRVLPDYRDEPLLAFAAAFDETAKLPYGQAPIKILGSPLLTAVSGRGERASAKLAVEERRRRRMMTRFVEAAFTLRFGEPAAAADQMETALQIAAGGGAGGGPLDAARLMKQADGFDAQVTLRDSIRAFKSLGDAAAGRGREALDAALRILAPEAAGRAIDERQLEVAVSRVQSPLAGFALTTALEQNIVELDLSDSSGRRALLIRHAKRSQARTAELLQSQRLRNRYPHLVALNAEAGKRLNSPDYYLQRGEELLRQGRPRAAIAQFEAGVKRHPESQALWAGLLDAQIDMLARGAADAAALDGLLARLDAAADADRLSPFDHAYYRAVVLERLDKQRDALASFQHAESLARDAAQRVLAASKAASLRARIAVAKAAP